MRTTLTRPERQARTREELIDAAEELFSESGFRATSLDAVADAAGYTKGAVYSNFTSKEDLFFAVYERRVDRYVEDVERRLAEAQDVATGVLGVVSEVLTRQGRGDVGWLAAFLEFWTHVLRHPEHRARFAAAHARAIEPYVTAMERFGDELGNGLPVSARDLAVAGFAMETGISLELLTQPEALDQDFGVRMQRLWFDLIKERS